MCIVGMTFNNGEECFRYPLCARVMSACVCGQHNLRAVDRFGQNFQDSLEFGPRIKRLGFKKPVYGEAASEEKDFAPPIYAHTV